MKNLATCLFVIICLGSSAQITLEQSYPTGSLSQDYLRFVKLSSSGYKYVINDTNTITLYNLDHTVFKTMTIPITGAITSMAIFYMSEELFDTDSSDVEYFVYYGDASFVCHSRVFDEFGNVLFSEDNTTMSITNRYDEESFVSATALGAKMIIWKAASAGGGASVYSLPGFLPCHDCSNGVLTGIASPNGMPLNGSISNPFPNPAIGQTKIEYTLPQGVTAADLLIYDISGHEIKRYKVTNAFNNIIISTGEFEAGTYFYQIQTPTGYNETKKMIVIK